MEGPAFESSTRPGESRLFTYPFFLFKKQASALEGKDGSIPVAWITLPDGLQAVEDAGLADDVQRNPDAPKSSLRMVRERGAYPAARKLYEGEYRIVGIYEDEPSALLDEFRVNWEEEIHADPIEPYSFDPRRVPEQLVPVAANRFAYAFFSYTGHPFGAFVPDQKPVVAIWQGLNHPFPVLLSNMRRAKGALPLSQALSFAYFLMPALNAVRQEPEPQRNKVEELYLINSYLEDPQNRIKSLGLLGRCL